MTAPLRVYRAGDPEPPGEVEVAVLAENGSICLRTLFDQGGRWRHGATTSLWDQLVAGDMVVVGIDIPAHPDEHAVAPVAALDRQDDGDEGLGRHAAVVAADRLEVEQARARREEKAAAPAFVDVPLPLDLDREPVDTLFSGGAA